jgi:hypothetical protein
MAGNPFTSAKAPAYNLLAPDIGAEQTNLSRQQQLAEMLRSQAMAPDNGTQVINGWAVKKSPWESVSKIASALAGNYMQRKADDKQLALAKAMQERTTQAFNAMSGRTEAAQAPQAANVMPTLPAGAADPGAGEMPSAPPPQQASQADKLRNMAYAAYLSGNKELSNKYLENANLMTDGQRNDSYLGITAAQAREAELAKRQKEGTMSLQPGQTNIMPDGSRVVAPNFETGVAGGFDAQGAPVAGAIPGSTQIAAERAGAVAAATSGANAQNEMTTVNIGGRPVMMTKAQAVQMSGGAPQGGTHYNSPDGGLSINFKGDPQATFDQISKIPDPVLRAEAMQALGKVQAPGQGGIGIQGSTPAEDEQSVGQVRNNLAIEKSRIENAQSPEQQQKLVDAQGVLGLLDAALPLLTSGVPTSSMGGVMRDKVVGGLGISTDASKGAAKLAAIGGALVSKMPKMSGPQSDKDVLLYKEMAGKLGDPSVPIGDRKAAEQVLRMLTDKYLAGNRGSIANQALQKNTGAPQTPTVDSLLEKYK